MREEEDRKALLDGLMEGTIDCICSAHEPHQEHLKHSNFDQAPAGVTSLDTCLTAVYEAFSERADNIPYKLAEWLSFNPAKIIKSKVVYPMEFLQTLQFWISIKVSNMTHRKAYLYPPIILLMATYLLLVLRKRLLPEI